MTTPRMLAVAVADLAAERVRDAWRYLDAWRVLTASGVPVHDLRHAMDRPTERTESTRVVSGWVHEGGRGLLVLRGSYGVGKTHAAVGWALRCHRAGHAVSWQLASRWPIDFSAQEEMIKSYARPRNLVLDEVGAGSMRKAVSADQQERLQGLFAGMLAGRTADGFTTIVISNASTDELTEWLGGAVMDRLRYAGGISDIDKLERKAAVARGDAVGDSWAPATKRARDDDARLCDRDGRSPRWHAAARLVDLIGCEDMGDGRLDVGRSFDAKGEAAVMYAIELLELELEAVEQRAAEIIEQDRAAIERIAAERGESLGVESLTWAALAPALKRIVEDGQKRQEREAAERRAELAARRAAVAASAASSQRDAIELPEHVSDEQAAACRELAKRYGLRVEQAAGRWRVFTAHRCAPKAGPFEDENQAWWVAAELLRPALEALERSRVAAESETP